MRWTQFTQALWQGFWMHQGTSVPEEATGTGEATTRRRRAFTPLRQRDRPLRLALSYILSLSLVLGATALPIPASDSGTEDQSAEASTDSQEQVHRKQIRAMALKVRPESKTQKNPHSSSGGTRSERIRPSARKASVGSAAGKISKIEAVPTTGEPASSDTTLASMMDRHRIEAPAGMNQHGSRSQKPGRNKGEESDSGFSINIQVGSSGTGCVTGPR